MNRAEIEREHWVERYLAGGLSDADARQFEAYWVENPELMRDLESCARLKTGLAGLRARGELDGLVRRSAWWPGRFRLLVLAACAVFAVVGLATWRSLQMPPALQLAAAVGGLPDHASLVAGERYTLLRLRSASRVDAVIPLPTPPAAIELRVLPEVEAESDADLAGIRYVASLAPEDVAPGSASPTRSAMPAVATVRELAADADGFVALFVDSRTLAPGRYRLRIAPLAVGAGAPGSGTGAGTGPAPVASVDSAADSAAALAAAGPGFVIDVRGTSARAP